MYRNEDTFSAGLAKASTRWAVASAAAMQSRQASDPGALAQLNGLEQGSAARGGGGFRLRLRAFLKHHFAQGEAWERSPAASS